MSLTINTASMRIARKLKEAETAIDEGAKKAIFSGVDNDGGAP